MKSGGGVQVCTSEREPTTSVRIKKKQMPMVIVLVARGYLRGSSAHSGHMRLLLAHLVHAIDHSEK
jgi:hypothetical protein